MNANFLLWCSAACLGLAVGWLWNAHASDCNVPEPPYLYVFARATLETDEGVLEIWDWDPLVPLPSRIDAYVPSEKGKNEPPHPLYFEGDENEVEEEDVAPTQLALE